MHYIGLFLGLCFTATVSGTFCPYGQNGICGGEHGLTCPYSATCLFRRSPNDTGICCTAPVCPAEHFTIRCSLDHFVVPLWPPGSVDEVRCPDNALCFSPLPETPYRTCCVPFLRCRYGEVGECAPLLSEFCPSGSTCMFPSIPGILRSEFGKCCLDPHPDATCPKTPSNHPPCIKISHECFDDSRCYNQMKCCPDICGNRCKYPVNPPTVG